MTKRAIDAIRGALAERRLVWFGIRGEDGEALLQIPELEASYSIIAPLRSGRLREESNVALEQISRRRPDLDRYDIDLDPHPSAREFSARLMREVSGRCVMMTYRPSRLISELAFSMSDTMTLAGLFKDRQQAFEYKPWVETALAARGILGLDWRYVADQHLGRAQRMVAGGRPHILRASRTSGGVGIALAETEADVERLWRQDPDSFVAVAPFLDPTVPINFSGVVFDDGSVRLHPASVQLIGIPSCTQRRFGYCGNDFSAIKTLGDDVLAQVDAMGRAIGEWLHEERYRGVFGVDALVDGGAVRFVEINARFQGSSAPSAEIAHALDVPDLFLDHLNAALGGQPTDSGQTIAEWTASQPDLAHVVLHNTTGADLVRDPDVPLSPRSRGVRLAQLPEAGVPLADGAAICRVTLDRSVTESGFALDEPAERLVADLRRAFVSA
ncbi:hypothetical protein DVA67_020400 [Solirubrobacter sp. CPCC 204708]|uniref:ATP-grasp domain-containing protein n=1 Tax=Solirubrobacter deserti TaxID=2282478 RepID=A0ABT4RNI7_9ACTN|nr:hypothetical protein [Solirubrobacter deserti]MBE2318354.1 hypothetical protein [Solirubrobacter deserti]MDA0140126.1 hypothetical protein [Solirubrobacter deserti]